MVGRDHSDRNDMFGGDDHRVGGHRHDRIEVAGREGIGEVAGIVGKKCMYQREIGAQRGLQQICLPIHIDLLLTFLDEGAHAGRCQHSTEAAAAGTDALDEGALRDQVDRDLLAQHLLLSLRIQPNMSADHARHLRALEQLADALSRRGRVIADQGKARFLLPHQFVEQAVRRADAHETGDHDAGAIRDHGNCFFSGNGLHGLALRWIDRRLGGRWKISPRRRPSTLIWVKALVILFAFDAYTASSPVHNLWTCRLPTAALTTSRTGQVVALEERGLPSISERGSEVLRSRKVTTGGCNGRAKQCPQRTFGPC
jgi:hypothetical protein